VRKIYNNFCYYVVAHQDDWQLFYGHQAFADLSEPNSRVIFIYTTAGDAGQSEEWWRARERGAIAAQSIGCGSPSPEVRNINGHEITVYDAGSFVSYHMRLPDGHPEGAGFPATGHASLRKLQTCEISTIAAIDGSARYAGWNDFLSTLTAIFEREGSPPNTWVNAADWSWTCSPDDHSDHKATADALRECLAGDFNRLWFATYSNKDRPANLSGPALHDKESLWLAYKQHVAPLADLEFLSWEWDVWGAKNYYRQVLAGEEDRGVC
jgi:hypothetical protein